MICDFSYWGKVAKRFFSLFLTVVIMYLIFKLSIFYLPFLVSFIVALLIEPLIKAIMKKFRWTRKSSSIFIIGVSIIIIVGLVIWGTTTVFNEITHLIDGMDNYFNKIKELFGNILKNDYLTNKIPEELRELINNSEADFISSISENFLNLLNSIKQWIGKVPNLLTTFFFFFIGLYFMCTDKIYMIDQLEHHLPDNWSRKLIKHIREITRTLGSYLKAELILIVISFGIAFLGLFIFKIIGLNIKYPLVSAIVIGFVDALPILGSGTAMIPWAIISSLEGDIVLGLSIVGLWIFIVVVRNIIEPKLISKNIGIHPVFTIISMFTGYKLIGIAGMIIGPIILIILKEIYTPTIDKGVIRSIFEES